MKYALLSPTDAVGAINAHTLRAGEHVIKKGRVLSRAEVQLLVAADVARIACVRAEADDVGEDDAAARLAAALVGPEVTADPAHTGRANLRATAAGVFLVDSATIAEVNAVDESITVATVPPDSAARAGDIIATVKIIPFAVRAAALEAACSAAHARLAVAPFQPRRAGLVLTRMSATHEQTLDRAARTQRSRLERIGSSVSRELRISHDVDELAQALASLAAAALDPILVMGSSAIADRHDVIPAALEQAGGTVVRYGMPVEPGNLLLLGRLGTATVVGLPGCARSLDRSGFDWLLERTCAGLPITARDIGALGVGGLLARGSQAMVATVPATNVAAIVLAAGHSSRMGPETGNKLLVDLDGAPMIRRTVERVLASRARPVAVVTGNDAERVRGALDGLDVRFVHNAEFATGLASSLRAGVAAVGDARAAMICLGDMPLIAAAQLDALADAFSAADDDRAIVVPTFARKRGNPAVLGRAHFAAVAELTGDIGARPIIERNADHVIAVPLDDDAVLIDVDTPDALAALRARSNP